MSILSVNEMTQGFGHKVIFNNVSFKLLRGEHIGLIGANGEGKTTFFKIITGEILPDYGEINWSSKIDIGYLDQNVELNKYGTVKEVLKDAYRNLYLIQNRLEKLYFKMAEAQGNELDKIMNQVAGLQGIIDQSDYYSIDSKIEGISYGLGIRELLEQNPMELSGGQRTKVLLAKLLLEKPDILLLDEPTNHLDKEAKEELKRALIQYEGSVILVSHEAEFYKDIVTKVWNCEEWRR